MRTVSLHTGGGFRFMASTVHCCGSRLGRGDAAALVTAGIAAPESRDSADQLELLGRLTGSKKLLRLTAVCSDRRW